MRALLSDDLLDELRGHGAYIGAVREAGIRHDGGRIGIDENDFIALVAEGLTGLGARIVELASLANDDRAGTEDHDLLDVRALAGGARAVRKRRRRIGVLVMGAGEQAEMARFLERQN